MEGTRLIPNVSEDWLQNIKRKGSNTKSKSPIKSEGLQAIHTKQTKGLTTQAPPAPSSPQASQFKQRLSNVLGVPDLNGSQSNQGRKSNSDGSQLWRGWQCWREARTM